MEPEYFPPALHAELSLALYAYAESGDSGETQLQAAGNAVCRYAHTAGMTPERLLIGLKRAYDTVGAVHPKNRERLRIAYEGCIEGCLQAYFNEGGRGES